MKIRLLYFFLLLLNISIAQKTSITGRVYNEINNEAIPFANIVVDSLYIGATSDLEGNYEIKGLKPGVYNITCSFIGFQTKKMLEISVSSARVTSLDIPLTEENTNLDEVVIKSSPFNKTEESPVSMRTISATEIYRNPGANRDISKVIQSLPGVAGSVSFRNDIIVRGGSPSENRFYLDGIEVPNINHFATQGSSGGPVGMINVNFIREVDFYAGAFPANRGNALSSVMEFKQIEGNKEKLTGTFAVGSSDIGLTLDGPIGKKSSFILSARRSYLQFLFKALALPFLPTYNDFQYKQTVNFNSKNKVTFIGLGAIDDFELNKTVNDNISDSSTIERNNYILGNLPVNTQWNYTVGVNWTHFLEHSYQNFVVSRNSLENKAIKYQNNIETPSNLILNYSSRETENKFRFEHTYRRNGWKINAGLGSQYVNYTNNTYNKIQISGQPIIIDYQSVLNFGKYSIFGQGSKSFLKNRLALSLGLRTDFNDYSEQMLNPIKQLSPRFSAAYSLNEKMSINFNTGRYYQLPAYTILGYRNQKNELVNRNNGLKYIQVDHLIGGLEYNPTDYSKISVEGFLKNYNNYPFSLKDSISLANLGSDFGIIGNEAISSTSQGKSYGIEFLAQQKLSSSIYGIVSYTYVRSSFKDKLGNYIPSAWDNRHILNITAGKKFKNNWELGVKFRFLGGSPYTPYNKELTALKSVWDITQQGIYDWNRINSLRTSSAHGIDIRIDKKWFYDKWSLNIYFDVQNVYNFTVEGQPYLTVQTDAQGNYISDPNMPSSYLLTEIANESGTLLPSIGLMLEF